MKTEDICKTLRDADIQNIDDAMIENVLNNNIQFASEKDVIHFFCLITHIRNNREHINRLLSRFENTTVFSFWTGMTRCYVRAIQHYVLDYYSFEMEKYEVLGKIKYGYFLLFIPDSINCEAEERIRCYECIQNWIKYDVHANGEVLIADNEIKTLNPNKDPFCEYLFLMSVNAEDLTDLLGK